MNKKLRALSNVAFYGMAAIVSVAVGLYLTKFALLAYEYRTGEAAGFSLTGIGPGSLASILLIAAVIFAIIICFDRFRGIPEWLIRYRYVLSAAVLVICCVFEISGSSLAVWADYLGENRAEGTLFGIPRGIRSDEWDVATPFSFSQVLTGNLAESPVIRGGETDVTLLPALPAWSPVTLFRPYYWGYLLLGMSRGLSFTWIGRLLALALVTFELARVFTKGNDSLSVCAAILVAMSPAVEWWFATNLLIFGQGLVLCLRALLSAESRAKRWLTGLLMAYLFCCYALELYPAWQVPLFYIFAAMGLWVALLTKQEKGITWKELLLPALAPVILAVMLCATVVVLVVWQAADVVALVNGTAYPGNRNEHGGGGISFIVSYLERSAAMIVAPLVPEAFEQNVCVSSTAIALAPFGFILLVVHLIQRKDLHDLFLLVPFCLLLIYGVFGLPEPLARLSLLSNTQLERLPYPMGYLDNMMLVYAVSAFGQGDSTREEKPSVEPVLIGACAIAAIYAVGLVFMAHEAMVNGVPKTTYLIIAAFAGVGALSLMLPKEMIAASGRNRGDYLLIWAMAVLVAGFCINPVQRGISVLVDSDVVDAIEAIEEVDPDGLWIGDEVMYGQACISGGARALSSVNSYPNLDVWHSIDAQGTYDEIYNRYAHVAARMADAVSFELVADDSFIVYLDDKSLLDLGIDYWLARSDLSQYNSDLISFVPIYEHEPLTIYKVVELRPSSS